MSTSYLSYSDSIPEQPNMTAVAYEHLRGFLRGEFARRSETQPRVYTSRRLAEIAGDVPTMALALALIQLVQSGWLEQFVRVQTPSGSGLQDFQSLEDLPSTVYDWKETFREIPVVPENVEVCYRLSKAAPQ